MVRTMAYYDRPLSALAKYNGEYVKAKYVEPELIRSYDLRNDDLSDLLHICPTWDTTTFTPSVKKS